MLPPSKKTLDNMSEDVKKDTIFILPTLVMIIL